MRCKICERETEGQYCEVHGKAYGNLVEKFEVWRRALGLPWKKYLREIAENSLTGEKAREVASALLLELEGSAH